MYVTKFKFVAIVGVMCFFSSAITNVICHYRQKAVDDENARKRAAAVALWRQQKAEEINRQEQEVLKNAPPLKLLRDH